MEIGTSSRSKLMTSFLLFAAILNTMLVSTADGRRVYCGNTPSDVVFLLDSSNSVWAPDFQRMLRFVADVTDMFTIGPNDTQVGLAIFNDRVELEFHLKEFHTKETLEEAILSVPQIFGTYTATNEAIRFMRTKMFSRRGGSRPGVVQVAIIITDGRSENGLRTVMEASRAKHQGIHIFAVGIGHAVYTRELRRIASPPSQQNAFAVNDFRILNSIQQKLAIKTCLITTPPTTTTSTTTTTTTTPSTTTTTTPVATTTTTPTTQTTTPTTVTTTPTTTTTSTTTTTTPTTTTTTPTTTSTTPTTPTTTMSTTTTTHGPTTTTWVDIVRQSCHQKPVDIVFALDSSNDTTASEFWYQIRFVRDFTLGLDIGVNKTRIGAVLYSDDVQHVFDVTDHTSLSGAIHHLYSMERMNKPSTARLDEAIRYVRTKSYRRSVTRQNVPQLLVLLVGSTSGRVHSVKRQVRDAEKTGVNILTVAFGNRVNDQELSALGGQFGPHPGVRMSKRPNYLMMEEASSLKKRLFKVDSARHLEDVVMEAAIEACSAEVIAPPVSDQACGTRQKADMMFVMDSASAGRKNTKKTMNFMKALTKDMEVERKAVQVGMMIPDECLPYTKSFGLNNHNKKGVIEALDSQMEDDLANMLKNMRKDGFKRRKGGRRNAKKIAIVIVDGELDKPLKALREARRAQIKGIEVFVIVVGQERPQPEVRDMCAYPPNKHFFQVPDYDRLQAIEQNLIDILCDEL